MHLLVLSAFRLVSVSPRCKVGYGLNAPFGAQCFPTGSVDSIGGGPWSQCTFWCSVLSDAPVLVALAFRHKSQCTFWCSVLSDGDGYVFIAFKDEVSMHLLVLSAFRLRNDWWPAIKDIASQCTFWCSVLSDISIITSKLTYDWSQCTFWCSVLSDLILSQRPMRSHPGSQCTFWCSVLSDRT